jgi:hypothetical protein
MIILIFGMFFIDKMSGGTQSFADQVVAASIVNLNLIYTLIAGVLIMIIERIIFKRNPKEWRIYFQYKAKKQKRPVTLDQVNWCLRKCIKDKKPNSEMTFDKLHYDEELHNEEIEKENKTNEVTAPKKKNDDDSHLKNPLQTRYAFLIILNILITFLIGITLPVQYTLLRVNPNIFLVSEYNDTSANQTSKTFVNFQTYPLYQIFYGLFLTYLIVSALQIRLGEPINKGRRELLVRFTSLYSSKLIS